MLLTPAAPILPAQTYTLRMPFRAGATWQTRLQLTLEGGETVTVTTNLNYVVRQVDNQGNALIESANASTTIQSGAESVVDERPQTKSAWFNPAGMLIRWQVAPEKPNEAALMAAITQFVAPPQAIAVGESWSAQYTAGSNGLSQAVRVRYILNSVTDGKANVGVDFVQSGENGMKATGTWSLEASSGTPLRFDGSAVNFLGQTGRKATITLQRVERIQ